jgi:hypothetical protein
MVKKMEVLFANKIFKWASWIFYILCIEMKLCCASDDI